MCKVSSPRDVKVFSIDPSQSGKRVSQSTPACLPNLSAAWYSLSVWWESSSLVDDGLKLKTICFKVKHTHKIYLEQNWYYYCILKLRNYYILNSLFLIDLKGVVNSSVLYYLCVPNDDFFYLKNLILIWWFLKKHFIINTHIFL